VALPRWQGELAEALELKSAVILCGNVRDVYLWARPPVVDGARESWELLGLRECLVRVLERRSSRLIMYDMISKGVEAHPPEAGQSGRAARDDGGVLSSGTTAGVGRQSGAGQDEDLALGTPSKAERSSQGSQSSVTRDLEEIYRRLRDEDGLCYLVDYADKLIPESPQTEEEMRKAVLLEKTVREMRPANRLVLVFRFREQIPRELRESQPAVGLIEITPPERDELMTLFQSVYGLDENAAGEARNVADGLRMLEVQQIASSLEGDRFELGEFERRVRRYKFGEERNPWKEISLEKINGAFREITRELKGQDDAVSKMIDIIIRSRADIIRKTGGNPHSPRGKLFFAGPTGVGKTLAVKKLAEFLFGSKDAMLRFDMSEYAQEFQVNRLFGAPPGYVGFEQGGTLTNAVKGRPFSVILFDEIEKAHSSVFDVFLQILEDGRLTDSRGDTVYFSESVIIFTSNLGTRSRDINNAPIGEKAELERLLRENDSEGVRKHFLDSVQRFFMSEISRPELLNRIGLENIIVFNYINQEEVIRQMFIHYLNETQSRFNESYSRAVPSLAVEISMDEVVDLLLRENIEEIQRFGGRYVENIINQKIRDRLALSVLQAEFEGMGSARISIRVENGDLRFNVERQG